MGRGPTSVETEKSHSVSVTVRSRLDLFDI